MDEIRIGMEIETEMVEGIVIGARIEIGTGIETVVDTVTVEIEGEIVTVIVKGDAENFFIFF